MKPKALIATGAVITVLAVVTGYYLVASFGKNEPAEPDTTATDVQTGNQAEAGASKTACDLLTAEVAERILGADAEQSQLPEGMNASTDDVSVSNCAFSSPGDSEAVSLLVRGAKTEAGRPTNQGGFEGNQDRSNFEAGSTEYAPTEPISGLGDAAFWDPDFKQVNVLVGNGRYWLIIQAAERSQAEDLARLLITELD